MPLTSGTRLGSYEIKDSLGDGGMGEVYRARDTKLHRDVAIKVLPEVFAGDPDRLGRFEREAHTLAALNHPNIAQIYGLEGSALVMELVDGEDLAARIARGALPLDESLAVARQVADALEAAHDHGIIHRDLKPANIKVRADATVKVLDFGLAKAIAHPETGAANRAVMLATVTSPMMTHAGIILGTAAYMAPEQARGHAVDKRADIWAFGCVVYEMLTGRRAFGGDNVTDTMAAVVRGEPDWAALPGDTPASIRRLLRRCLEKDRKRRLADAADARLEIEAAQSPDADDGRIVAAPQQARRLAVPIVATAIVSLLAGAAVVWRATRSTPPAAPVVRLQAALPAQTTLSIGVVGSEVAISPDGARIMYVAQGATSSPPQLFVRTMDRGETSPIAGTEQALSPFFSPDGEMVAFARDGSLLRIGVRGGSATTICAGCAPGFLGGAWAEDGTIVFARGGGGGGLLRLRQDGQISPVTSRADGESRHGFPSILPGGAVIFTAYHDGNVPADIVVMDPKTGQRRVLVRGGHQPRYVPPGYLVFSTAGALHAVRFDLSRLEVVGTPVPVVDRVITKTTGGTDFAVSRNGSLLYASGDPVTPVDTFAWVDRDGREEAIRVPPHVYVMVRVSPDGQYAVFDARDEDFDLWLWDFRRRTMERLTSQPESDGYPVWSRNENRRLYLSLRTRWRAGAVPDGFAPCPRADHKSRRSAAATYDHHPRREMAGRQYVNRFCGTHDGFHGGRPRGAFAAGHCRGRNERRYLARRTVDCLSVARLRPKRDLRASVSGYGGVPPAGRPGNAPALVTSRRGAVLPRRRPGPDVGSRGDEADALVRQPSEDSRQRARDDSGSQLRHLTGRQAVPGPQGSTVGVAIDPAPRRRAQLDGGLAAVDRAGEIAVDDCSTKLD